MKGTITRELTITEIPVDRLDPNPWNPNRMTREMREKLRLNLQREGFVNPLTVRSRGERFQIINGEHRWLIAKELGHRTVPCVVLDLDDRRARILTINLNELGGDPVPALLARLLHDLEEEMPIEEIAALLPYGESEIRDLEALLKIPEGLEKEIEEEAAREEDIAPELFSFIVPREHVDMVNLVFARAMSGLEGKNRRSRAFVLLAKAYIKDHARKAE